MSSATAPYIIEALNRRLIHGVFGYSRWKDDEFLTATAHQFSTQYYTAIDPQSVVYGPSVIYVVSELIRQWSETDEGVVIHAPVYDAFYKAIRGNQRTVIPVALEKQPDGWFCGVGKLETVLVRLEYRIMPLCSPQNPAGKVWTRDKPEIMVSLYERHDVRVTSGETHMGIVWGEQLHIPWNNVIRGDWALLTSGPESFSVPALTSVYGVIENGNSRDAYLSTLRGHNGLSSSSVLTLTAHIAAYRRDAPWPGALCVYLKDNLTYITDKMDAALPELNWQIPQSTHLTWLDLRPSNIDDNALQKAPIEQEKIAIMLGYTYGKGGRGFVRLNIGCPRSRLEEGVAGLINAIRAVG